MNVQLRLIRRQRAGDAFPTIPGRFAGASFALPFSAAGTAYYGAALAPDYQDHSFALTDAAGAVLVVVRCGAEAAERLTTFAAPIEVHARDATAAKHPVVVRQVLAEITRLAATNGALLRTSATLDPAGRYANRLQELGTSEQLSLRVTLDLAQSDDEILADMRQGHRQQVRWGMNAFITDAVDRANPDRAKFELYRALHAEIAGRVTRPPASWDAMFDLISQGSGDLVLSWIDGQLLGGTLVLDSEADAHYSSGAYRRDAFDKPLTHYPLFLAAQRARLRGRARFDVGETVGGTISPGSAKENAIGTFKRGFSSAADVSTVWRIAPLATGD